MKSEPLDSHYKTRLPDYGLQDVTVVSPVLFHYKKGEYLCREGEPMNHLLYVTEGRIKISTTSSTGKTLLICFYQSEGIIGCIEALAELPAMATAQAVTEATCISVAIAPNGKQLRNSVSFLRYLNAELSLMFAHSSRNSAMNILYPLGTRLCSYIVFTQTDGLFRENLTETCELLGVSYRHLLRSLEELCGKGLLEKQGRGSYRIVDYPALKSMAEDYYAMPGWKVR